MTRRPTPRCVSNGVAVVAAQVRVVQVVRNNLEVKVQCSKCLPQSNEKLCCLDALDWRQVMAYIKSNRTNGRCKPETHTHGICVLFREILESDSIENVAAIIERCKRESFF